jgi:predicted component of type VI protein secretion system
MTERELLEQLINRNINNILNQFSPGLRMFSGTLTNYAMEFLDPYLAAFTNNGTNNLNTKAATQFMKEETNKKIEEFMKRFEEASGRDEM